MRESTAVNDDARYCLIDTAIGDCGLAWSAEGLTRVLLPGSDRAATERQLAKHAMPQDAPAPAFVTAAIEKLTAYAAGEKIEFSGVPLDWREVGGFDRQIYQAALKLGWGETASYGELAKRIGQPGAARSVGQSLGRNPWPVIVPCHRILAKGQRIGGFSAPGGVATKQHLLALEGTMPGADAPMLPGLDLGARNDT